MPTPDVERTSSTRFVRAKPAASSIRPAYRPSSAAMNGSSPPNPVSNVTSTSMVSRGSPQRCRASPPMKQKRQSRASQKSCRSAATRISSSTARCRPQEPALLLDQARRRPRSAWGSRVIRLAAQQGDRALRVEAAELLATHPFEPGPGLLPDLNPPPARGDLLGAPAREGILLHPAIVATHPETDPGQMSHGAPALPAAWERCGYCRRGAQPVDPGHPLRITLWPWTGSNPRAHARTATGNLHPSLGVPR